MRSLPGLRFGVRDDPGIDLHRLAAGSGSGLPALKLGLSHRGPGPVPLPWEGDHASGSGSDSYSGAMSWWPVCPSHWMNLPSPSAAACSASARLAKTASGLVSGPTAYVVAPADISRSHSPRGI